MKHIKIPNSMIPAGPPPDTLLGMQIRRKHFPDIIRFHNPGLRRHHTSEISCQQKKEFVSISLTGTHCALDCKHCGTNVLRGMNDFSRNSKSLFELCSELGISIREMSMARYDIYTADESFLTGTAAETIPMVKLDEREIGDGKPGPISLRLIEAYRQKVRSEGTLF